jgi:hypothetical protein
VHADLDAVGLWALNYMPGVRRLVAFGDQSATIDAPFFTRIRERLVQSEVVDKIGEILEPGDRVEVISGPCAELDAIFDRRLSGDSRVRILIQWMQKWTKVELDTISCGRKYVRS